MALKLYRGLGSGNAYKAELMLRLLDVPYETVEISIPRGDHRSDAFLRVAPFGQIPVLVDEGAGSNAEPAVYSDSQAILCYLARRYGGDDAERWLPTDAAGLAHVMRWLSVAANEIQNGPTMARAALLLKWDIDYDRTVAKSYTLLERIDAHLAGRDWLAAGHATVADIACYPYLLLAAEGGVDTAPYAHVTAWMRRVEALPRFWPMERIPGLPPVPLVPAPAV